MNRTKTKEIDNVRYCIYCGNESVHDVDYYNHGREEDHYETCGCEELKDIRKKELYISDLQKLLVNFKNSLYDKNKEMFNKLEYEVKLKKLKDEYEQD